MTTAALTSWPTFGQETYFQLADLCASGKLSGTRGDWQLTLEQRFREYTGARHVLSTNGGTNALLAGLHALGIGPGDDVIVPAMTFSGSAMPVLMLGARVIFADVDPDTYNVTARTVRSALARAHNPKAVMVVHLHGLVADVHGIRDVCDEHNVPLVEDACQAHGAMLDDTHMAGTLGAFGAFSLNTSKAMPAGDGGLLVTNDDALYERARAFRTFGEDEDEMSDTLRPYRSHSVGGNFRLPEISALLAVRSLEKLPEVQARARRNGALLTDIVGRVPGVHPPATDGRDHTYHKYRIRLPDHIAPSHAVASLRAADLPASRWQTISLPEDTVYREHPESCSVARYIVQHSIVLFDERHPLCAQHMDTVQQIGERMAIVLHELIHGTPA